MGGEAELSITATLGAPQCFYLYKLLSNKSNKCECFADYRFLQDACHPVRTLRITGFTQPFLPSCSKWTFSRQPLQNHSITASLLCALAVRTLRLFPPIAWYLVGFNHCYPQGLLIVLIYISGYNQAGTTRVKCTTFSYPSKRTVPQNSGMDLHHQRFCHNQRTGPNSACYPSARR